MDTPNTWFVVFFVIVKFSDEEQEVTQMSYPFVATVLADDADSIQKAENDIVDMLCKSLAAHNFEILQIRHIVLNKEPMFLNYLSEIVVSATSFGLN